MKNLNKILKDILVEYLKFDVNYSIFITVF